MTEPVRPPVSLSMALSCRLKLWLAGHGYPQIPPRPQSVRTFDYGHFTEAALLGEVQLPDGRVAGPWWSELEAIHDYDSGRMIWAPDWEIVDRQKEVEWLGYKGHVDCILVHKDAECKCEPKYEAGTRLLPDVKSTSGIGYKKSLKGNLLDDKFARGYVGQLHAYREGLHEPLEMLLIYVSKEQSKIMCRFITYDKRVVMDAGERLAWATSEREPEPDWNWNRGEDVPLVCGYCPYIESCSQVRGIPVELTFQDYQPKWRAK